MTHRRAILLGIGGTWLWLAGPALAEVGAVSRSDGTGGKLTQLGDDFGIYSDSHGNTGPVIQPARPSPGPHGNVATEVLTPFGTPVPPNNLTPAPVLPISPNRPPPVQQSVAPSPSAPQQGFRAPGGSGRFGR
jgi:hypothetical protein